MAGVLLFLLLIAPVHLGAAISWTGEGVQLRLGAQVWGLGMQGQVMRLGGRMALRLPGGRTVPLPQRRRARPSAAQLIQGWHKTKTARRVLAWGTKLRGGGRVWLGGENAALIAWWTGLLRCISGCLPQFAWHLEPRFDGGPSSFRGTCIIQSRLGILLAAWILGAAALRKKEETPWTIPSAA